MLQPDVKGFEIKMGRQVESCRDVFLRLSCLSQLASRKCAVGIFGRGRVGRGQQ